MNLRRNLRGISRRALHTLQRRAASLAALVLLLAIAGAACNVQLPVAPTPLASPSGVATIPAHAPEIRFGLIGTATGSNVWALFDAKGTSYNNYAIRSDYWPRLYHLALPGLTFQPVAAGGMPSAIQEEGALYAATVPLRADLKWSDGSAFTADDVAFTVNTALSFQLGFDWRAYYDPDWLEHAEAVDAHTVKFYFKQAPNVAVWQYGALQGPIVQRKYWASRLSSAAGLLPTANDISQISGLNAQVTELQARVDAIIASGPGASGDQSHELRTQQGNLDAARKSLENAQALFDSAMNAARQAMYSADDKSEPTLGTWSPVSNDGSTWTNEANPSHPFGSPSFDRAIYRFYPDESSALAALNSGQLNAILEAGGLSPKLAAGQPTDTRVVANQASSVHFVVINPLQSALQDPVLRQALSCSIERAALADPTLSTPLDTPVMQGGGWFNDQSAVQCGSGSDAPRAKAVELLKAAGYTWVTAPTGQNPGQGLTPPGGTSPIRPIRLLAPDETADAQAAAAAQHVQDAAQYLGIPLKAILLAPSDIRFAVFNDRQYEAAILGWRLGTYPGYLCDWFGAGNPYGYSNSQLTGDCQKLGSTSDLTTAQNLINDMQTVLAQDPAFIPLYSARVYDVSRGILYPFDHLLNGLSGVYGAPSLAIPSAP